MMRSLYTAVSGLTNHQTKMDVIGNNIANINTTGYKSNRATFADTLSQTISGATAPTDNIGGTNPQQIGLGMQVSSIDTDFSAGSPTSTGNNTDLAISSNNGLFIVKNGDQTYYTRNGNFTTDADGNLVMNGSGLNVQGWNATNGVLTTGGTTENLKIDMNSAMQPSATTSVTFAKNLSADDAEETIQTMKFTLSDGTTATVATGDTTAYAIGDTYPASSTTTITGITLTLADSDGNTTSSSGVAGASYTLAGTTYPSHTSIATVYDSLGATHSIPVNFQRTSSTSNTWIASVTAGTYDSITIPSDVTTTLTYDGDTGKLTSGGSMDVTMSIPYPNGATQSQTINLDFNSTTQYSGETNVNVNDSDGYAAGFYKSMTIGSDGIITMTYTNGQKQSAGQIAIANFNNPGGLDKAGGSLYEASNNSGVAQVGTFAANGIDVTTGALEMSNVNTAREFSEMITTQRGFQANSKIITVSDEMLETLIGMKR